MNRSLSSAPVMRELVEALEADIIFGVLRPNQELTEDVLMDRFDAKRHVVRSVIQELVNRRLVVKPRAKSARVRDFTLKEVDEIYHMREILQREAVRIIPLPVDAGALDLLKEAYARHAEAVQAARSGFQIHCLNDLFHECLFDLCENRELCKAIGYYTEVSNPIRSYGIANASWLQQAVSEHGAMIRAIEVQDRETLMRLVVDHMQPTRQRWVSMRTGCDSVDV